MSGFNGSGTFQISGIGLPYVSGTTISSATANTLNNDLATGLSNCITKDGQQVITANIGWNNHNINNLSSLGIGTATPSGQMQVMNGATTNFIIDSSGNVGIGTSSPTAVFDVYKSFSADLALMALMNPTNGSYITIASVKNNNAFMQGSVLGDTVIRTEANSLCLGSSSDFKFGSISSEYMRIDSSGNVGIGTTSPSSYGKLSTYVTTDADGCNIVYDVTPSATQGGSLNFWNKTNTSIIKQGMIKTYCANGVAPLRSNMQFSTLTSGSLTTKMELDYLGNIGLGRIASSSSSNVVTIEVGTGSTISAATTSTPQTNIYANAKGNEVYATTGYASKYTLEGRNHTFSYSNSGTANAAITGWAIALNTIGGSVYVPSLASGSTTTVQANSAGMLLYSSDSRLKQEMPNESLPGLAEVMQIQPKAYKWLEDIERRGSDAVTEIGFFANQVAPIIPSAAPKNADGYYGFYDRAIIAALVKATQELKTELDAVKSELATLKGS